jgi:Skp family chaperone for outer membrane proteins
MDINPEARIDQLSAEFRAFQQELREMRRESDEKWLAIQLEIRDRTAETDAKLSDKIAASNDKFNSEMSSLSRDNTRFSRTIIIGAAVVSVISPVIKEIAPFVTELIKTSITK